MDFLQENILPSLRTYSILLFRKTASALTSQTPDQIASTLQTEYLEPYLLHPLSDILDSSSSSAFFSSSNLISALILVLTLYISLRILDYARRVVMFWVTLVIRLAFWASLISAAVYVYNVGPEKALADAGWIWGVTQGFVEDFVAANNNNANGNGFGRAAAGSKPYGYSGKPVYRGARRGYA